MSWASRARGLGSGFALAIAVGAIGACADVPKPDDRLEIVGPDRASFPPVEDLLVARCGTVDCHGSPFRNLKLYGRDGLRLDPRDEPGGLPTTAAETDATYRAVVRLEPEPMAAVVREAGRAPERLSIVRKARGAERHKGLALWAPGDDADRCLTSWLAGATDVDACRRAAPR